MEIKAYRKALSYAFVIDRTGDYKDLVHDSFIVWFDRYGTNLFDQHNGVITRVIRNVYYNKIYRKLKFYWRGEKYNRMFYSLNIDPNDETTYAKPNEHFIAVKSNQEDFVNFNEKLSKFKEFDKIVLHLTINGNNTSQIADKVDRSLTVIQQSKKRIKQLLEQ